MLLFSKRTEAQPTIPAIVERPEVWSRFASDSVSLNSTSSSTSRRNVSARIAEWPGLSGTPADPTHTILTPLNISPVLCDSHCTCSIDYASRGRWRKGVTPPQRPLPPHERRTDAPGSPYTRFHPRQLDRAPPIDTPSRSSAFRCRLVPPPPSTPNPSTRRFPQLPRVQKSHIPCPLPLVESWARLHARLHSHTPLATL